MSVPAHQLQDELKYAQHKVIRWARSGTQLMKSLNDIVLFYFRTISETIYFQLNILVGPLCFDR